jgi:nucleoside-diphosphate-sugar epimerase
MTINRKILVSGASGFIGARIVEILHLTGIADVRAGIRNWANCARISRFPIEIVNLDILNMDEVRQAIDGVTHIIHCAYGSEEVTVRGTRNILQIAHENKIQRVIHLSTTEVYGNFSGTATEEFECSHTGNSYADSKLDAEKVCLEFIQKELPIAILRLPIVYGPFSRNWTVHIAKMLIGGDWAGFGKFGDGNCNLLYIDDLFRAIMAALEHEGAVNQIFNINGPDVITWNDYLKKLNASLGLPELMDVAKSKNYLKSFYLEPIRIVGNYVRDNHMDTVKKITEYSEYAKKILKKVEGKLKATPSPEQLSIFSRDVTYDISKAKKMIGFSPKTSIDEGIRISVEWLKHHGFLNLK